MQPARLDLNVVQKVALRKVSSNLLRTYVAVWTLLSSQFNSEYKGDLDDHPRSISNDYKLNKSTRAELYANFALVSIEF